jgi:hypothetical protein
LAAREIGATIETTFDAAGGFAAVALATSRELYSATRPVTHRRRQ